MNPRHQQSTPRSSNPFRVLTLPRRRQRRHHRFSLATASALLAALVIAAEAGAIVPLVKPPAWRSTDSDYSTGAALIDLDGDGFLDLVTANGNDMARQPVRVYHNAGGMLETIASWSSADIGYNCHLDAGDWDGDGDLDVAVALLGNPGTPQRDKIYENVGGVLSTTAAWTSGDLDNSFDLAWGDADGDGDLDLAVACGESYTQVPQRSKIYRNNNGVIETTATWFTSPVAYTLDVAWGDVDNDGDLDLACGNEFGPNRIYLNNGGGVDSVAAWVSADAQNTIQIDWGDVDGDGWLDLAVADNAQLGGVSRVAIYRNTGGTLSTLPTWISADAKTYASAVAFADVDNDGDEDLASGGWWEPVIVYENIGGVLETTPSFSWTFNNPTKELVVESVVWGDLDNSGSTTVDAELHDGNGARKVFYLVNAPLRSIDAVRVDGSALAPGSFSYDLVEGWVALGEAPATGEGNVSIDYVHSAHLDLVVTNWHAPSENLAFLNDPATSVASSETAPRGFDLMNAPNPFVRDTRLEFRVATPGPVSVTVFDVSGRVVRALYDGAAAAGRHELAWNGADERGRAVAPGTYFCRVEALGASEVRRMTLVR